MNRREVLKKAERANKRLATMRRSGLGDLSVIPLAMREHKKIIGKDTDKFIVPKETETADLILLDKQLDKFLASKWTSQKGRAEIYRKRLATFEHKEELKLTKTQALKFFDIASTDTYSKLIEMGLDSDQIVNLVRKGGRKRTTTFEKALTSLFEKATRDENFSMDDAHKFLEKELKL